MHPTAGGPDRGGGRIGGGASAGCPAPPRPPPRRKKRRLTVCDNRAVWEEWVFPSHQQKGNDLHLRKKIAVLTLATTGAVGAAGVAFAFWTTDGSGAGNAATGTR